MVLSLHTPQHPQPKASQNVRALMMIKFFRNMRLSLTGVGDDGFRLLLSQANGRVPGEIQPSDKQESPCETEMFEEGIRLCVPSFPCWPLPEP